MIAVFGSIGRADLPSDRGSPPARSREENHPVKSRPYSRSGTGDAGITSCLKMEPDHVLYRSFHIRDVCSPFVSDIWQPVFSDGETIADGGMYLLEGGGGQTWDGYKQPFLSIRCTRPCQDLTETHRSPLRARLYLVSLTPRIHEGIKPENTGTGPEQMEVLRQEYVRSYLATLQGPKASEGGLLDGRTVPGM
jgi:hypothetical protein